MAIHQKVTSVGNFLAAGKDFRDGDMLKIASDGQKVDGKFGIQDVFLIKTREGKEGNLAFNQTTINNMIDAYGNDSIQWVGKVVKAWVVKMMVSGSMKNVAYLSHPKAEMVEDSAGRLTWPIPGAQPVAPKAVEYPTEEINPDDIPF